MITTIDWKWYTSDQDSDMLWLEDSINWDSSFDLAISEYSILSVFTAAVFYNTHHFLDWLVKLSTLDLLFINEVDQTSSSRLLFFCVARDLSNSSSTLNFLLPLLFHSDYQDLSVTTLHYAPELVFGSHDFTVSHVTSSSASVSPSAVFDTYQDSTSTTQSEFLEYFTAVNIYCALVVLISSASRLISLANDTTAQVTRVYMYLYSMSVEVRFQFEAALQVFFFVFLYASMMMATFDDDQEELSEFFNTMCYYFFLFTLLYYFYKYSIHYFSYLEAAKGEAKATSPLTQFLFDALNTIAFVLRFLVLMIRLNIYDGVDDVLDSYYIFMADFEEEEYFSDTFFSMFSVMSFDTDVNDDRSFLFEDEMDLSADLFTIYLLVWGKFAYFWLFILEEIARVGLALYVTYLVIFEINAVNRSYVEDNYLAQKRSQYALASTRNTSNV